MTVLRAAVLIAGGLGTLFWIGTIVHWWNIPAGRRDGLELIGPALSTAFLAVLVLPTLVLGLIGRWATPDAPSFAPNSPGGPKRGTLTVTARFIVDRAGRLLPHRF